METTAKLTTVDANDASNATSIDKATATPSLNNSAPDMSSFTYSHEEVRQLLEDAKLDGWEEGYEEGSKKLMESYKDGYEARQKLDEEKRRESMQGGTA